MQPASKSERVEESPESVDEEEEDFDDRKSDDVVNNEDIMTDLMDSNRSFNTRLLKKAEDIIERLQAQPTIPIAVTPTRQLSESPLKQSLVVDTDKRLLTFSGPRNFNNQDKYRIAKSRAETTPKNMLMRGDIIEVRNVDLQDEVHSVKNESSSKRDKRP